MKRKVAFLCAISLFSIVFTVPANSAVRYGVTCKKIGSKTTSNGAVFTCIKSGKKLIWSDWVVSPSLPIPKPLPTVSKTHASIKNFQDLATNFKEVQYWAWKKSSDAVAKNKDFNIPIEVVIGPNSKRFATNDVKALQTTYRIFGRETSQSKIWLLYGWTNEPEWVKDQMSKILAPLNVPNPISVRTNLKGEAVLWASYDLVSEDKNTTSGATDAHEYMHTIQHAQLLNSEGNGYENWGYMPRWMVEGGGQYVQDYVLYGGSAESWIANPLNLNQEWRSYDLEFFKSFLQYKRPMNFNEDPWGWTSQWPNQRVYDVGALVYQVLIAVKDPESILLLMKDISRSHDFNQSFQSIYGISWNDAEPLVAEAIFKMTRN